MKEELKENYLKQIKDMKKKEAIKHLEEIKWNIDMIDRWNERNEIAYDVLCELLKEMKGGK